MRWTAVACIAAAAGCAPRGSATPFLDATLRAVGGREAVTATRTLAIEGEGEYLVIGQGRTADQDLLPYGMTQLTRTIDYAHGRARQSRMLTPRWAAQDPSAIHEVTALDGDVAFDVDTDGTASRDPRVVASDRRAELRHSPLGLLQTALAPGAVVSRPRRVGDDDVVDIQVPGDRTYTLSVDARTRLPRRVTSMSDDSTLGDVVVETELADYQRTGDLMLPTRITSKLDHQTVMTLRVTRQVPQAPAGDLAAPAAVKAASDAVPAPTVTTEVLAPGVWLVAGGSHNSVVVEQADHLLLIEAPYDDARALAVFAAARALRPDKPLTHVVCTHHHSDHAGGVRAAVAQGLTVIAHQRNQPFLADLVARPHTLVPDALARAPRPLALETVGDHRTIDDPAHPVELFAADSPHAADMLVVYLPRDRLLIEADLFTPVDAPGLRHPNASVLVRLVEANHLNVERVVPLHREVVPFAALVAAAGQTP